MFTDSPITEQTNKTISHFMQFNQSFKSLEGLTALINSTPGAHYQIPSTKYKIKKLINPQFAIQYYVKCIECEKYSVTTSNKVQCECATQLNRLNSEYFVYLPFASQIKKTILDNFHSILSYRSSFTGNSEIITDVQDGIQFRIIQKKYPESIVLSLTINTDGAKIFNSTTKSVWPIQIYQNFLPPKIRFAPQNIVVVGLHSGKPLMRDFFYPFLKELKQIYDEGGIKIERNGQHFNFLPLVNIFTGDVPAKTSVQCMNGHTGYFACGYCFHKGELIKKDKNSKAFIRYIRRDCTIRTHKNMLETYQKLKTTPINGVKSMSCMIAAEDFDLINGFSIDYMHAALLGIMKKLMQLWLDSNSHDEPYYISKKRQVVLSKRILCIKPISEITRKPRSIFEKNDFKANEFRSLLLYYLRYCLVDLLPMRYIHHFQLFSSSIYILLQEEISQEDISIAEKRLNDFADKYEELYGKFNVTMNLHLLRHIANCVRHLGPLWAHSTFSFETNNGVLVKSNQAKNDFLHCLSWRYTVKSSLNKETKGESKDIYAGGKTTIRIGMAEISQMNGFGFKVDSNILSVHRFISFGATKITSLKSKEVSTVDFFVELATGEIGIVHFYVVDNDHALALIEIYQVIETTDHLKVIQSTKINKFFDVNKIKQKMLYMKIEKSEIVCTVPNRFEKT